ncbi:MAG: flagellar motor protein MotD [Sulfuricella sp.]|nr:flagellar motor protein MotD [Sulfuricella sp.]
MARKKKPEEHENLERWLVSYADFITLLFAFFVVMYAISQVNEGKYKLLSDSLLQAFKEPTTSVPVPKTVPAVPKTMDPKADLVIRPQAVLSKRNDAQNVQIKKETEKMKGIAKDLMKVMERLVKTGQVKVTQSARGIAVEINASVLFGSGNANLEGESVKVMKAVAEVLTEVDNNIQVEGYSDNAPINSPLYPSNWELSSARASSVARLFVEGGIQPDRVVVLGYGENRPVASNDTPDGRARNRRVTIMILSPGHDKVISDIPINESSAPAPAPAAPASPALR